MLLSAFFLASLIYAVAQLGNEFEFDTFGRVFLCICIFVAPILVLHKSKRVHFVRLPRSQSSPCLGNLLLSHQSDRAVRSYVHGVAAWCGVWPPWARGAVTPRPPPTPPPVRVPLRPVYVPVGGSFWVGRLVVVVVILVVVAVVSAVVASFFLPPLLRVRISRRGPDRLQTRQMPPPPPRPRRSLVRLRV